LATVAVGLIGTILSAMSKNAPAFWLRSGVAAAGLPQGTGVIAANVLFAPRF
jgi:hypothetical protein